jgi:pimeloyl-ACP methyl ester carboxylesterase
VIAFDNVGVGGSTGTAPETVAGMAADTAAFIDVLAVGQVDLIGHSMEARLPNWSPSNVPTWSAD